MKRSSYKIHQQSLVEMLQVCDELTRKVISTKAVFMFVQTKRDFTFFAKHVRTTSAKYVRRTSIFLKFKIATTSVVAILDNQLTYSGCHNDVTIAKSAKWKITRRFHFFDFLWILYRESKKSSLSTPPIL